MKKVSVAAKFSFRCEQYYAVPVNGLLVYNNTVTQQFLLLFLFYFNFYDFAKQKETFIAKN